ncbi:MAG: tRNA uridine-5-carboxymethylaminomethyl(34) synthesis GTPase MnmE [Candidatus Sigynarchaeota archaeon]
MGLPSLNYVIAAIATPPGKGAVGIVRVSGNGSLELVSRLWQGKNPCKLSGGRFTHGKIRDPNTQEILDEALLLVFRQPHSYTGQDSAELHTHGSPAVLRRVLHTLLELGARPAQPGEFTLRAYLNGKMDLAQAEAVLNLVESESDAARRQALRGLSAGLSQKIANLSEQLFTLLAHIQAWLDYPEEGVEPVQIQAALEPVLQEIQHLLATAPAGRIAQKGARIALVGAPNAGKSSLLNALLRMDRAIVTPIPGTTRDTLEETLNLQGVPFVLVDTAGIVHAAADLVEQLGIERSRRAVRQADLVLVVVDGSEPLRAEDHAIAELTEGRAAIVVINKCDLPTVADVAGFLPGARRVRISALIGEGLDNLRAAMLELAMGGEVMSSNGILVSSVRHKEALARALGHLEKAEVTYRQGLPADFVTIDLRAAADALGEITGQTVTPDLLDHIFANFCIGK